MSTSFRTRSIPEHEGATDEQVKVVKASFNLPEPELDALRRVARMRSVSVTQALRQAIALLVFLADLPKGTRLIADEPNGTQREIVFHNF